MSEQDDRTERDDRTDATTESTPPASDQTTTSERTSHEAKSGSDQTGRGGRAPRFGTILWGVLLLVFAGAMLVTNLTEVRIDPLGWITGAIIATGAVLVVAGIAAAVRRRP
ncbi:hypothetical protein [Plantibacter sp. Leaf314]|uniref:hypothetical protein n=1 Tax=Plantibacter sp. Leaf314 TaxID=1736333 RepID=UPI0006F81933|nr:hypothetical protein [Plantibacter sp. Leaf314]KQQ51520.1 hypothetical protein ASF68_03500 [Plantibacter sp. Leaf314]